MDGRIWNDGHQRFSADLGRRLDALSARLRMPGRDPLPLVARAMALVLAVSVASLTLGSPLA
jgi:hypothetical protein